MGLWDEIWLVGQHKTIYSIVEAKKRRYKLYEDGIKGIIEQNEKIIEQNEEIIKLLKKERND